MNNEYKKELLKTAFEARTREVTEYQVNIDNFRAALVLIGEDKELSAFKAQLEDLLTASLLEQRKAKIMLEVITSQIEA